MRVKVRVLRIHHESEDYLYELYDRDGKWTKRIAYPIAIHNLPRVLYFGYCPIDTDDVTLDFGKEVTLDIYDSRKGQQG